MMKIVCDAIIQLKADRETSVIKTSIQNTTLSLEQDKVVHLIGEEFQVACKISDVARENLLDTVS